MGYGAGTHLPDAIPKYANATEFSGARGFGLYASRQSASGASHSAERQPGIGTFKDSQVTGRAAAAAGFPTHKR